MPQTPRPYDPFEDPYAGEPLEYDYGSETGAYNPLTDPFAGEPFNDSLLPSTPWAQTTRLSTLDSAAPLRSSAPASYDPLTDPYAGDPLPSAFAELPIRSGPSTLLDTPLRRTTDIELPIEPTRSMDRPMRTTDIELPPEVSPPSQPPPMRTTGQLSPAQSPLQLERPRPFTDWHDTFTAEVQKIRDEQQGKPPPPPTPGQLPPIPPPPEPELNFVERDILRRQQFGEAMKKSALDIATGIPTGMAAMAYGPEQTKLREMDVEQQKTFIQHQADPGTPEYWAQVLGNVAGSGIGFGALAAVTMGVGGVGPAAALASGGEALMEATLTYKNLIVQGKSQAEAKEAAGISFATNLALNKFTNRPFFEEIGGDATVNGILRTVAKEPTQELGQGEISNVLEGQPFGTGAVENVVGGLAGGVFEASSGRAVRGVPALPERAPSPPGGQVAPIPPPIGPPTDLESLPPPPPGMVRPSGDIVVGPPPRPPGTPSEEQERYWQERLAAGPTPAPLPSQPLPNVLQQLAPRVEPTPYQEPPPTTAAPTSPESVVPPSAPAAPGVPPSGPRLVSSSTQIGRPPHALDDELDAVSNEQFVDLLEQARTSAARPGPYQNDWTAWTERLVASHARRQQETALPPPPSIPVTSRRGRRSPPEAPEVRQARQWAGVLGRARDEGYTGSEEALRGAYEEIRDRAVSMGEAVETGGGRARHLLEEIARAGGMKVPRTKDTIWGKGKWEQGEAWWIAEASTAYIPGGEPLKDGGTSQPRIMPFGDIAGVRRVVNQSGHDIGTLREALGQVEGFRHYAEKSDNEFLTDLVNAVNELQEGVKVEGPSLSGKWWSDVVDDTGVGHTDRLIAEGEAPEEHAPEGPVEPGDTFEFGETVSPPTETVPPVVETTPATEDEFKGRTDEDLVAEITTLLDQGDDASLARARKIGVVLVERQPPKKKGKKKPPPPVKGKGEFPEDDAALEGRLMEALADPARTDEARRIGVEMIRRNDARVAAEEKQQAKGAVPVTPKVETPPVSRVEQVIAAVEDMENVESLDGISVEDFTAARAHIEAQIRKGAKGFNTQLDRQVQQGYIDVLNQIIAQRTKAPAAETPAFAKGTAVMVTPGGKQEPFLATVVRGPLKLEGGKTWWGVQHTDGTISEHPEKQVRAVTPQQAGATTTAVSPKIEDVTEPFAAETPPTSTARVPYGPIYKAAASGSIPDRFPVTDLQAALDNIGTAGLSAARRGFVRTVLESRIAARLPSTAPPVTFRPGHPLAEAPAAETPPTPPSGPQVGDRVTFTFADQPSEGTIVRIVTTEGGRQRVLVTTAADIDKRTTRNSHWLDLDRVTRKTEDVNEFGETQPRLPGAEDVREQAQKPEPKIEVPFTLDREKGAPPPKAPKQRNVLEMVAGTTGATTEEAKASLPLQPDEDVDEQPLRYNTQGGPGAHGRPAIDLPPPAVARAWLNRTDAPPATDAMRPTAIVEQLKLALEQKGGPPPKGRVPISRGGFKRKAWGIYKPFARTIRIRVVNDLAVIFHESGHAIDAAFDTFSSKQWWAGVFQELEALGANTSPPSADRKLLREEGVAELLRLWLTEPARVEQQYPNALRAFEQQLAQNAPLEAALLEVRQNIQGYLAQDLKTRGVMRIDSTGTHPGERTMVDEARSTPRLFLKKIYIQVLDDLAGVAGVSDEGVASEAYRLMRIARYASGKAEDFLVEHGVTFLDGTKARDKKGNVIGSLKSILEPVAQARQLEAFGNFLLMRHVQEVQARGLETGISKAEADEFMTDIATSPHYQLYLDTAEQVYAYQLALMTYMVDAGVMSRALYRRIVNGTPEQPPFRFYVPMMRSFDIFEKSQGISRSVVNRRTPVFKQVGSGRDIISPLESIVANTVIYVAAADNNRGMQAMYTWATSNPGLGDVLEDIEHSRRVVVGAARVAELMGDSKKEDVEVLDPQGKPVLDPLTGQPMMRPKTMTEVISEHGVDLAQLLVLWYDSLKPDAKFREVLIMVEGEPKLVQINNDALWDSIVTIGPKQTHWLFAFGQAFVTVLRFFVTQMPAFIIRNFMRDPLVAMTQGRFGQIPYYDSGLALWDIWKDGIDAQFVKSQGIAQTTMWGADRSRRQARSVLRHQMGFKSAAELNKKGYKLVLSNGVALVSGIFDALQRFGVAIELAPRVAEARLFREAGGVQRRPGVMGIYQRGQAFAKTLPGRTAQRRAGGSFRQPAQPWAAQPLATIKGKNAIGPMPMQLDLTEAAIRAAEVTIDFRKGGSATKEVNRNYAFLNARVQGVHRMVQTAKQDKVAALLNYGTMMVLTTAMWAWNHAADDDDDEAGGFNNRHNAARRQNYWLARLPGGFGALALAKPFEHALTSNIVEATLDYLHDRNPLALQQVIHQLPFIGGFLGKEASWKSVMFGFLPTAALASFEYAFNYNSWTGKPTVSIFEDRPGGVDASLQGRDYTSNTLTWLTAKLRDDFKIKGLSPAKIQQFLSGHVGTAGDLVLAATDPIFDASSKWDVLQKLATFKHNWRGPVYASPEVAGQSDAIVYFYQQYQEMQSYESSINRTKTAMPERAESFREEARGKAWFPRIDQMEDAYKQIGRLMDDMSKTYDDTTLTTDQRVQKVHELRGQMAYQASQATGTGRDKSSALTRLLTGKRQ